MWTCSSISAVRALCHQDCVVEVARRFAVDGDDGKPAKIGLPAAASSAEMRDPARLGQHIFGEDARQLVLADHHFDVHAEVVRVAKHLDDAAHGRTGGRGPTGDLHIDHQAFQVVVRRGGRGLRAQNPMRRGGLTGCGQLLAGGNEDGLSHALVEGNHICPCARSERA